MKYLRGRIERLRQKMNIIVLEKGISHPEVLKISQQLDEVINEFYNDGRIRKAG